MKLRNIQNGAVVTVISEDKVRKVVQVEFEADGKTKDFSMSTIKRWWREIKDDKAEEPGTPEADAIVNDVEADEVAGDGTPYKQVSNELIQDEKKAIQEVKKQKKAVTKTTNPEVPDIVDYIDKEAKKVGMNFYIRDKQPNFKNYRFDNGKVRFTIRIVKHQVEINCKSRDISKELASQMDHMNGFYDKRLIIKTLDDNKNIITEIIKNYKKEEK